MSVNCLSPRRIHLALFVFWLVLFSGMYCQAAAPTVSKPHLFPRYKAIDNNVTFWEKIFSHYSLTQAVIHDSTDLSKIYAVIPLFGDDKQGASRFNSLFQQQAVDKYKMILKRLATHAPVTADEKRVSALFPGKNRHRELILAADTVRSQQGQKERFLAGVRESGRYMQEIKKILRAYRLPEELAYLPHVESSFNYRAYSKAGAAGIWQFTRTTGKQYLTIDYTLDERLDPILATHAAAKYLERSYRTLHSWPLALTAYNYGLAGMVRATNEQGDYVGVFKNYNKGHFKFASRNFYSEFVAALKVARHLEKSQRIRIEPAQAGRYLNLPGYVHIKDAARRFRVPTETLVSLNPALRPPVINGEKHIPKGYAIRLPAGQKIDRLVASTPKNFYAKKQKSSVFHRVQRGDTAISIARLHGIPLQSLISANNLDKSATIYPKQRLMIPKPPRKLAQADKRVQKQPALAYAE